MAPYNHQRKRNRPTAPDHESSSPEVRRVNPRVNPYSKNTSTACPPNPQETPNLPNQVVLTAENLPTTSDATLSESQVPNSSTQPLVSPSSSLSSLPESETAPGPTFSQPVHTTPATVGPTRHHKRQADVSGVLCGPPVKIHKTHEERNPRSDFTNGDPAATPESLEAWRLRLLELRDQVASQSFTTINERSTIHDGTDTPTTSSTSDPSGNSRDKGQTAAPPINAATRPMPKAAGIRTAPSSGRPIDTTSSAVTAPIPSRSSDMQGGKTKKTYHPIHPATSSMPKGASIPTLSSKRRPLDLILNDESTHSASRTFDSPQIHTGSRNPPNPPTHYRPSQVGPCTGVPSQENLILDQGIPDTPRYPRPLCLISPTDQQMSSGPLQEIDLIVLSPADYLGWSSPSSAPQGSFVNGPDVVSDWDSHHDLLPIYQSAPESVAQPPVDTSEEDLSQLSFSDCLTVALRRLAVTAENLELLGLEAIPVRFDDLETRAMDILADIEARRSVHTLPPADGVQSTDITPAVPTEGSMRMLSRADTSFYVQPVSARMTDLVMRVADVQEGVHTIAAETFPQHLVSLERLLIRIQAALRARFNHEEQSGAGLQTPASQHHNPHPTGQSVNGPPASTCQLPNPHPATLAVPRPRSLMFFSQELNSAIFHAATTAIFKFADIFGGLSPYEMEIILSASTAGVGTYEDTLSKLKALEGQLVSDVVKRMGPIQLLDNGDFQREVEKTLSSNGPYLDLQSDLLNMRASRLRSQAILDMAQRNETAEDKQRDTAASTNNPAGHPILANIIPQVSSSQENSSRSSTELTDLANAPTPSNNAHPVALTPALVDAGCIFTQKIKSESAPPELPPPGSPGSSAIEILSAAAEMDVDYKLTGTSVSDKPRHKRRSSSDEEQTETKRIRC
ncbi:hypothetical protein PGTUg99_018649 [Puccinia graminis f. sp. tritici]|uniref:Uncharacterized protein n=1 Tax=Puccinia graminis f. sp. tritici TaxID=56615 RepID=A0A5B0PFZ1_PUCGR|nr:hypothetical protein PGTUg99_018649 [Puccinia graminis f. sp. tritici]